MPARSVLEVGFGRASLWNSWKTTGRLADDIDVRVLIARSGGVTAALAVADLVTLWPATCLRLRDKVAAALGISPTTVGIFTTQNHGAEVEGEGVADHDLVDAAFVQAARQALENLMPVEMARVAVHPQPPLAFCRRVPFGDLGKFTFWYGFRLAAEGRPDYSLLLKKALARLSRGEPYQYRCPFGPGQQPGEEDAVPQSPVPVPEPLYLSPAQDNLLQGLFFRTPDGRPVGSLLRYAAHPNAANRRGADWHSGDYPAYLRRRSEQIFGGSAIFMTGPCGDQATPVAEKSLALAEEIGRQLADTACAALASASWQAGGRVAVESPEVVLRIRPDLPVSVEAAKQACAEYETRLKAAAAAGRPLAEIKRLSDQWERQIGIGFNQFQAWCGLDLAGRGGQPFVWPLFVMRIGEAVIAGLPGEPFGGYSRRLREETLGDALITAEECNGYLSYLPTAAEFELGGYGSNASIVDRTAEDTIVKILSGAVAAI